MTPPRDVAVGVHDDADGDHAQAHARTEAVVERADGDQISEPQRLQPVLVDDCRIGELDVVRCPQARRDIARGAKSRGRVAS